MDFSNHRLNRTQYSNSDSSLDLTNSNSTVSSKDILVNLRDLVHEGYEPFYVKRLRELGIPRFMELAGKARAGSDNPQKLFSWMLKNNEIVK